MDALTRLKTRAVDMGEMNLRCLFNAHGRVSQVMKSVESGCVSLAAAKEGDQPKMTAAGSSSLPKLLCQQYRRPYYPAGRIKSCVTEPTPGEKICRRSGDDDQCRRPITSCCDDCFVPVKAAKHQAALTVVGFRNRTQLSHDIIPF
jgi:hypothetical protein